MTTLTVPPPSHPLSCEAETTGLHAPRKPGCRPVLGPSDSGVRTVRTQPPSLTSLPPVGTLPVLLEADAGSCSPKRPSPTSHPRGRPTLFLTCRCSRPTCSLTEGSPARTQHLPSDPLRTAIFNAKPRELLGEEEMSGDADASELHHCGHITLGVCQAPALQSGTRI